MVKVTKKSSSAAAAAAAPAAPAAPAAELLGTKLSPEKKKKKRIVKKDMEVVDDDDVSLHLYQRVRVDKILPEGSKTLFVSNLSRPTGRKIEKADFEKFFQKVGKVVKAHIELVKENNRVVYFAEIEFESHDVAKKALRKRDRRSLRGCIVELDVSREGSCVKHDGTDFTYQRHFIYIGFGKALKGYEVRQKLEEYFGSCGEIKWIHIPLDWDTGIDNLKKAYIEFKEDGESFSKAFELDGTSFMGTTIRVRRAKVFITSM